MASHVAEDRFDWRGPASTSRRGSLFRKLFEQIVPPKGQKVLPSASGLLLIFIGLTIGLAAYNTENNILFAALALLVGSIILSGIVCWGNLLCARWRLETSSIFRVGEEGTAAVVLENARNRFPLFCVSFGLSIGDDGGSTRLYLKERLDPHETTQLVWRFKPTKRMRTQLRLTDVVSSFPFGFLAKHLAGECETAITIWPARLSYARFRNPGILGAMQGASSRRKGSSGELIGLRQYQKGDAPREIHWKVSAKQGRLIVKQNASETQSMLGMVIDPSHFLWGTSEAFEKMCAFAATLAEDLFLESKLDSVSIVGGPCVKVQRVTDLESVFDALADLQPLLDPPKDSEVSTANCIVFKPVSKDGVGAFVNECEIAQA